MKGKEKELFNDMIMIYRRANNECKYKAKAYIDKLIIDNNPIKTAIDLVSKEGGTEGFIRLWELKRLDLSVEALVLEEKYHDLFSENIRKQAQERLFKYGYQP